MNNNNKFLIKIITTEEYHEMNIGRGDQPQGILEKLNKYSHKTENR